MSFYRFNTTPISSLIWLLIGVSIFVFTSPVLAASAYIDHIPPIAASLSQAVEIDASVEGDASLPMEARVYYRSSGEDAFAFEELFISQFMLNGEIPAAGVKGSEVEYYIWVGLQDGSDMTFPVGAPDAKDPIRVPIRTGKPGEQVSNEAFIILSPSPGELLVEPQALIAVAVVQNVRRVNPDNLELYLNGENITKQAEISESLVSAVSNRLQPGEYTVNLTLHSVDGKETLLEWGFLIPKSSQGEPLFKNVKGKAGVGYAHEDISEYVRDVSYLDLRVSGDANKMNWAGKAYLSSLENPNEQPQNRYLGSVRYGAVGLRVGDVNPRLSEFSMWGVRARGTQFQVRSSIFDLDVVYGNMRRPIEGVESTEVVTDDNGVPIPSLENIGQDSMKVSFDRGSMTRKATAVRTGFGLGGNSKLSFSFVKIKDDMESIDEDSLVTPVDNLVIGGDLKMNFDNRRVQFSSEAAISLYNSDISDGPMSDLENLENIIVINQNFDPLPNDTSILDKDTGTAEKARKILSELTSSAMAHRTQIKLNYFRNEFQFSYKTIGKSFHSLGSPTVLTDVAGISIQDRVRMLNNRIYLTVGYESYADNVNGRSDRTLDRDILRGGFSYYTPVEYPNFTFGMRLNNRLNDGSVTAYEQTSGDTIYIDNRIDDKTTNYNFSIDQSFRYRDIDNTVVFALNSSVTDNNLDETNTTGSDLGSYSVSYTVRKGRLIETTLQYSSTNQTALGDIIDNGYNSISLSSKYMMIPKALWLRGALSLNSADGTTTLLESLPTGSDAATTAKLSALKYSKTRISLGADYTLLENHKFNLNLYQIFYSDDGYIEYFDSHRDSNSDNSNVRSQDDFVTRLRYSYSF